MDSAAVWMDQDTELELASHCQFILTFGCPPTEGVPAKSTIARSYLNNLFKEAEDGFITFPTALQLYRGTDAKAENV